MKDVNEIIDELFGEQNLYKIDRWEHPDKKCKHNQEFVCKKCADEIKEEDMRIEITLHDDEGQPAMIISSCHQENLVNIRILDGMESREVSVEDLRAAVRKITAK